MLFPLDGPSLQGTASVNATTPTEIKVGGSPLAERKVVTIQPLDGKLWVYFGNDATTPSQSDLQDNGFEHPKKALRSYEAGDSQKVWVLAQSGTVDVRFAERS